jgi:hypothetical protein
MACASCRKSLAATGPTYTTVVGKGSTKGVIRYSQLSGSTSQGEETPPAVQSSTPVPGDAGPGTEPVENTDAEQ